MASLHRLSAHTGAEVPLTLYEPEGRPRAVYFFMPALGTPARFYRRLGEGLAAEGIAVAVLEQRGHGDSPYRPSHTVNFGYKEYLEEDIPAARAFLANHYEGLPFYMGGHSLGCHMTNMTVGLNPAGIDGVIHVACVFPYVGLYNWRTAFGMRFLCLLIPLLGKILGYYPGKRFGFGANEFVKSMMDWRVWALKGTYDFGGYGGIEEKMEAYKGRFLSLEMKEDAFASDAATAKPRAVLSGAEATLIHVTEKEQGDYIGHFDWARKPDGIVHIIRNWIL